MTQTVDPTQWLEDKAQAANELASIEATEKIAHEQIERMATQFAKRYHMKHGNMPPTDYLRKLTK